VTNKFETALNARYPKIYTFSAEKYYTYFQSKTKILLGPAGELNQCVLKLVVMKGLARLASK